MTPGASKSALRLESLEAASRELRQFASEDLSRNIAKAGLVKAFEFTFELCWKCIKAVAEEQGVLGLATPRDALRAGVRMRLLSDADLWLRMQKDRNTTAHTYDASYAEDLLDRIRGPYLQAIEALATTLRASFQDRSP